MKFLCALFLMAFSLGAASNECVDTRRALFPPCHTGEQLVFVQGNCTHDYEAESHYCSAARSPTCIDTRVAYFERCPSGKNRIFVQGRCANSYEAEHTYCATR